MTGRVVPGGCPARRADGWRRLWAATSYCLPVGKRRDLLGVTEEQARADLAACERHVRAGP